MAFLAAMVLASGGLWLTHDSMGSIRGAPLLGPTAILEPAVNDGLRARSGGANEIDDASSSPWQAIVIHHSGSPAGDAETLHRLHVQYGLDGLGYHFVIGNGSGLGDGVIHVGYRWRQQLPGAHATGPNGEWFNRHAIAICLIGNGDAHPFTAKQVQSLERLVSELQERVGIPESGVVLHREIAEVRSPGQFFDEVAFRAALAGLGSDSH